MFIRKVIHLYNKAMIDSFVAFDIPQSQMECFSLLIEKKRNLTLFNMVYARSGIFVHQKPEVDLIIMNYNGNLMEKTLDRVTNDV